ncbi:MAG: ATP synthase subunit C [Candidatus Njordarchaeales archaeon]
MRSSRFLQYLFLGLLLALSVYSIGSVQAQEHVTTGEEGLKFLGMALSTGLAAIAAGYAVARTGEAAIAAITEKPELFGRTILYVGLAEGIAIYGILISFLIWIT